MNNKKTIYLFHGEENYLSLQKLKLWKQEFIKKHDEINVETLDGSKLDIPNFQSQIETLPFLGEKRLIIVKNFLKNSKPESQKQIAEIIEKTPNFCILVFYENQAADKRLSLYKKIQKLGHIEEFPTLEINNLNNWILNKAKQENIKINFATANYLTNHSKPELWQIAGNLEKLKLYAQGQEITTEMIDKLVTPSLSSSVFKLTDKITEKNSKAALQILHILQENGEELTKIFYMIVRTFRILIQAQNLLEKGISNKEIGKTLKLPPFVIQKISKQVKNFPEEKLKNIYSQLLEIDTKTKTGIIRAYQKDNRQFQLTLEKLIIECCI